MINENGELVVVINAGPKIASINEYLIPVVKTKQVWSKSRKKYIKKHYAVHVKSDVVRKYQEWVISELRKSISLDDKIKVRSFKKFRIVIEAIFRTNYDERDASNIIKNTEDALFTYLKTNDKYVQSITSEKYSNPSNSSEYLVITISESKKSRYQYR